MISFSLFVQSDQYERSAALSQHGSERGSEYSEDRCATSTRTLAHSHTRTLVHSYTRTRASCDLLLTTTTHHAPRTTHHAPRTPHHALLTRYRCSLYSHVMPLLLTYHLPPTRYRCSLYSHMVPANAEGAAQQGPDVPPPVGLTEQQAAPALLTLPWPQP